MTREKEHIKRKSAMKAFLHRRRAVTKFTVTLQLPQLHPLAAEQKTNLSPVSACSTDIVALDAYPKWPLETPQNRVKSMPYVPRERCIEQRPGSIKILFT